MLAGWVADSLAGGAGKGKGDWWRWRVHLYSGGGRGGRDEWENIIGMWWGKEAGADKI